MMQTRFLQEIEPRSKRLLIVVDGSEDMGGALDYVISRAVKGSPIEAILLNVQPNQEQDRKPCEPTEHESGQERCAVDNHIVRSAARRLAQLGIVNRERVEVGDPAVTIVRCAEEEQCDLIVLADPDGNSAHSVEQKTGLAVRSVLKQASHQIPPVPVVIVNRPQRLTTHFGRVALYVGVE